MNRMLALLVLVPIAALAQPNPAYEPVAYLAGHCWKGAFPDGKVTDEHCFSWIYEGRFLRDTHTVRAPGRPDYVGESTYFWNAATKQLEYIYLENQGGFSRGLVTAKESTLVFPAATFVETSGTTQTYRSRWERIGDSAYEVSTEMQASEGWKPWFRMRMEKGATRYR